jgi:hypothetical protein
VANLSQQAIQELRQTVNDAMKQPSPHAAAAAAGAHPDFCTTWKTVKPILQLIGSLPIPIPGVAAAINALILVADQICTGH